MALPMDISPKSSRRSVSLIKNDGADEYPAGPLILLLFLVTATEGADIGLFPAVTKALERSIGFDIKLLGPLATAQLFSQAVGGSIWGIVATRKILDRKIILAICTMTQGIATGMMWYFMTPRYLPVQVVLRCVNGFSLGGLRPIANSIIGDRFDDSERGKYFGIVAVAIYGGAALSIPATIISEWCLWGPTRLESCPKTPADCSAPAECVCSGLWGWEMAFIGIGALTILLGPFILAFLRAPPVPDAPESSKGDDGIAREFAALGKLLRRPTFTILVLQGCFGVIPWRAFDFRVFFFETAGLDKGSATTIHTIGGVAGALGSFVGGRLGDALNNCWPLHGRVLASEIAIYGGIPFCFFTFFIGPAGPPENAFVLFLVMTSCVGFIAPWPVPATNAPILSSMAEPSERALVLSWQIALEGSVGALGAVLFTTTLGLLGYDPDCNEPCTAPATCPDDPDQQVRIVGTALLLTSCIPWGICGVLYSFLHLTFPKDLAEIEAARRERAALGDLNTELAGAS